MLVPHQYRGVKILRMIPRIAVIVLLVAQSLSLLRGQTQKQSNRGPLHGTVNVILANGNTLVAATDSMLTQGQTHAPIGIKLYKIDDRTIATMASFYEERGPTNDESLTASIPQIVSEYSSHASQYERLPFDLRANTFFSVIEFKLSRYLRAMVANNPRFPIGDPNLMLELTVAGFDRNNSIGVAEITLVPGVQNGELGYVSRSRPIGSYTPPCEFTAGFKQLPEPYGLSIQPTQNGPVAFTVGGRMFCEIAGLRDVPEHMLASPASYPNDLILQKYANAQSQGEQLSASDLRGLAVDLVEKTAADERRTRMNRVGGEVEVAVLSDGRMIEAPKPLSANGTGSALNGNSITLAEEITCRNRRQPFGSGGYFAAFDGPGIQEIEATLRNCNQALDGIMFLDSTFIDSHLTYSGRNRFFFPSSNKVLNTTLELGPGVDAHTAALHDLICGFPWKSVTQQLKELKSECGREAAK